MQRSHLIIVGTTGLLLLGVLLELVRHFLNGDVAALAGALCLAIIPLLGMSAYWYWDMEQNPVAQELSDTDMDAYVHQWVYPRVRPYVVPAVFGQTVLIGLWIGAHANRTLLIAAVFYAVWFAIGRVFKTGPRPNVAALSLATLAVAAMLGRGLAQWLGAAPGY